MFKELLLSSYYAAKVFCFQLSEISYLGLGGTIHHGLNG
jgi:hypothetical protein